MKKTRILLVVDNRLLREGIVSFLKEKEDLKAVAAAGTNESILQKVLSFKPHIVVRDLGLQDQNNLLLVKSVMSKFPSVKMVVMNLTPAQTELLEFIRTGVSGFILKDATAGDFVTTIRSVAQGKRVLPPRLTASLFTQIIGPGLPAPRTSLTGVLDSVRMTRRERQVIDLISEGMTNKEIGERLHLSTYTVKSHVHRILEKLTLNTRIQIAKYAHSRYGQDNGAMRDPLA